MPIIKLEQNHIEYADHVGLRRREMAIDANRKAHNGAPVENMSALKLDITGARAECAFYVWIKPMVPDIVWNAIRKRISGLPDFNDWIDVKARTKEWHSLIVQEDDPPDWAYPLVLTHLHPVYQIDGWLFGYEAKKFPITDPAGGRPAHFVKQNFLNKDMDDLVDRIKNKAL